MTQIRFKELVKAVVVFASLVSSNHTFAQQAITFVGQTVDQTDFLALGFGQTAYYFPQFGANNAVTERATNDNMRLSVPSWLGFQFDISAPDRTFSPDAGLIDLGPPLVFGVYSEGGKSDWDSFTLPDGSTGRSGSVVDLATSDNSNNTVNRIQLGSNVPSSFFLRIVIDNTNLEHNPVSRLAARGDSDNGGGFDVRETLTNLTVNGTTDIYSFRYDNFVPGDFIKIQLNSGDLNIGAGFGGLMFDVIPDANFDQDNDIDGADFLTWQKGFGMGTTFSEGDANYNESIDSTDLSFWEAQFGTSLPPLAATRSVPEPSIATLLALGALSLLIKPKHVTA